MRINVLKRYTGGLVGLAVWILNASVDRDAVLWLLCATAWGAGYFTRLLDGWYWEGVNDDGE